MRVTLRKATDQAALFDGKAENVSGVKQTSG